MNIAVLGTGIVGTTIATKLVALGHTVTLGSRTADNAAGRAWLAQAGASASLATFADAAAAGDLAFLCTKGEHAVTILQGIDKAHLADKIIIDVTNPLDFSRGMPPTLFVSGTDSLGEQVQRAVPHARVVKSLNTVNCNLMVDANRLPEPHTMLVAGDDAEAKVQVTRILREWFGWQDVVDVGGISAARGLESWLPLWIRLWGALGTPDFNMKLVRAPKV